MTSREEDFFRPSESVYPTIVQEEPRDPSRRRLLKGAALVAAGAVAGAGALGTIVYLKREDLIESVLGGQSDLYTQLAWRRIELPMDKHPKWEFFAGDPKVTSENPADWTKL